MTDEQQLDVLTTILTGKVVSPEWVELLCDADRHQLMPWQRKYYMVGGADTPTRTSMLRKIGSGLNAV